MQMNKFLAHVSIAYDFKLFIAMNSQKGKDKSHIMAFFQILSVAKAE